MGGHFPDEKQTLLLKSALSDRLKAIRYFVEWLEIDKLDTLNPMSKTFLSDFMDSIDLGSQRLLPLVIHNLGDDTHPYFKFLIGTRKNYWVKNKQIAYKVRQVLEILKQNSVPYMIIKGVDLAERFYENQGLRPMYNGDILIPFEHKNIVFDLAEKGAFGNKTHTYSLRAKSIAQIIHLEYDGGEMNVDLHWSIFREYAYIARASDFIWQGATKEVISGFTNYKISVTHAFFVSIVRGFRFEPVPPFRWVADAKMIAQNSEIDWNALFELSSQFHYKPFLKRAFSYLAEQHLLLVPNDFIEKLNALEVSEPEQKYYNSVSCNSRRFGILSLVGCRTLENIRFHRLFAENNNTSLVGYLFSWYFNRIIAKLSK